MLAYYETISLYFCLIMRLKQHYFTLFFSCGFQAMDPMLEPQQSHRPLDGAPTDHALADPTGESEHREVVVLVARDRVHRHAQQLAKLQQRRTDRARCEGRRTYRTALEIRRRHAAGATQRAARGN